MKGKVCVVTGATRGIGRAVLERFVQRGAMVIGTYLKSKAEAENMCIDMPVEMHRLDMGNVAGIKKLVAHIQHVYGRVDILVNNAGVCERVEWPKVLRGVVEDAMRINFEGPLLLSSMLKGTFGRDSSIINIGSIQGQIATKQPHYAASKAALHALTKFLSREMAPFTRVNTVAPGYIRTDLTKDVDEAEIALQIPLGRFGNPSEVAYAVEFLAEAQYITGETLNVNGGMHIE